MSIQLKSTPPNFFNTYISTDNFVLKSVRVCPFQQLADTFFRRKPTTVVVKGGEQRSDLREIF